VKCRFVAGEVEEFEGQSSELDALTAYMRKPLAVPPIAKCMLDPEGHRRDAIEAITNAMSRSQSMPGDTAKAIYEALFGEGLFL